MFNLDSLMNLYYKVLVDYFKKIIPKTAASHKEIIQRLSVSFQNEADINKLSALINDVYAEAYTKALLHCKEKLDKSGIKFNVLDGNSNPQN